MMRRYDVQGQTRLTLNKIETKQKHPLESFVTTTSHHHHVSSRVMDQLPIIPAVQVNQADCSTGVGGAVDGCTNHRHGRSTSGKQTGAVARGIEGVAG